MSALKVAGGILLAICLMTSGSFASDVLTNESVMIMMKAGLSADIIVSKIKTSPNKFDTSVEEIIRMKNVGVTDEIIKAMIIGPEDSGPGKQDADYRQALSLMQEEKYDEAINILSGLAANNADTKYHIPLIESLLEKSTSLKETNDPGWKPVAYEAQNRIKGLYAMNSSNADYWIVYAKFFLLIEKDSDVVEAFEKVFLYKPGYVKAIMPQGDIYYQLARRSSSTDGKKKGEIARSALKSALSLPELTTKDKAEIFYKLGELDLYVFDNVPEAISFWKQSVATDRNGKWAALSQKRLSLYDIYNR